MRVVEAVLGVVDPGLPEEFDQVAVVAGEAGDVAVDGDRPAAG
ncbi:hypothetical protein [Streptomyces sp. NPDC088246]